MRAIKTPSEKVTFVYDFANELGLATLTGTPVDAPLSVPRGTGANLTQLGSAVVSDTNVLVVWQGGVDGESYLTTVKMVDSAGNTHERDGEIFVSEKQFTIPLDTGSRYLTADEYVDRYGYAETVRLTDEDKQNVVDKRKLEAALKDATDIADGYIGTRYTTPLVDAPRVVKSIIGALAREMLHRSRPTPEVKDKADQARSQLRDIASGKMTLPVDQGQEEPVIGGNRYSITTNDPPTTFRDAVSEFSVSRPRTVANWRQ